MSARTAALAALIAFNDAADEPTEDIDGLIAELITELAGLAGDPQAVIDAARAKSAGRHSAYRVPASVRARTANDLMQHYLDETTRLGKAANYAYGATLRATKAGNTASQQRSKEKWHAFCDQRSIANRRLTAVCGAYDAANAELAARYAAYDADTDATA